MSHDSGQTWQSTALTDSPGALAPHGGVELQVTSVNGTVAYAVYRPDAASIAVASS